MPHKNLDAVIPMLAKLNLRNMDFLRRASVLKHICEKNHLQPYQVVAIVARSNNRAAVRTIHALKNALDDERIAPGWKAFLRPIVKL